MARGDVIIYVLQYAVTPAAVVAAVAWLFRTIVLEGLKREGDALRARLERDSALAIEQVRHEAEQQLESVRYQLNRSLEEHKVRFARLQDKRVEPLLTLYSTIAQLSSGATHLQILLQVNPADDVRSDIEDLKQQASAAREAYLRSLLFLPSALARSVDVLIRSIENAETAHYIALRNGSPEEAREAFRQRLSSDYGALTGQLADQIRALLGVESVEGGGIDVGGNRGA